MDLELRGKLKSVSLSKGPPESEFNTIRPAYSSRGVRIALAQKIVDERAHVDVPEKAVKNA